MKKISDILAKAAYCIAVLFLLYLFLNSIHYTFHFDLGAYLSNCVYEGPASRFRSILILIGFSLFFVLFSKLLFWKAKDNQAKKKRVFFLSVILSVVAFVLLVIWISYAQVLPWYDQETVMLIAKDFNAKDYFRDLTYWMYLRQFPQQFGLVFIEAMLLHIWDSFLFLEYINALLIALIIFFGCRLTLELTDSAFAGFVTLMATAMCLPLYYYSVFIYGDIFGIFACIFVSLMTVKWLKTNKLRYIIFAVITACIMVPARKNSLIFLIALAIVLFLVSIKNKKISPVILGVTMLVLPMLCSKGTQGYYEKLADYKIENTVPTINWVVMGLRGDVDCGEGVGFYDGYVTWYWYGLNQDSEATKELAKQHLSERLTEFKNNPSYARRFFRYKILEQWDEPTFASIYMTASTIEGNYEKMSLLYKTEVTSVMQNFMACLQVFVYFFALICFVFCIIKDNEYFPLIIAITFVGGFLFSIIWEAGGRYVFPYFVFLIPAAGMGLWNTLELAKILFTKLKGRRNG